MRFRWIASLVVLVPTFLSRTASAAEPILSPAEREAASAFHPDLDLGMRSLRLDGLELRSRLPGSSLAVAGEDVGSKATFETRLRLGLRYRGVLAGVGMGFGVADWGPGRASPVGDIVVRPNGFVVSGAMLAYAGYRYAAAGYAARLEGHLGAEIVGIGLERPGFPETRVPYINGVRGFFSPRITLERSFDDVSLGLFVETDVVNPGNVMFGLTLTPWLRF